MVVCLSVFANPSKEMRLKYLKRGGTGGKEGSKAFCAILNKTISEGGTTVDFWIIKVHTSN